MSKYNIVQTGPKSQFGGLKNGLLSVAYHPEILGNVAMLPIAAATKGITSDVMSLMMLSIIKV